MEDQPQGVYLVNSPEALKDTLFDGNSEFPGPSQMDTWRVPAQGLEVRPDPLIWEKAVYTPQHLPTPELYRPYEKSNEFARRYEPGYELPEPGPKPEDWVAYHDWHELGNPSDEEWASYGIGHDPETWGKQSYWKAASTMQWQPGQWGKGLILDGQLHTWNTTNDDGYFGVPHHSQYLRDASDIDVWNMPLEDWNRWHDPVVISPEGWYARNLGKQKTTDEVTRFAQAHPALKYVADQNKWERRVFASVGTLPEGIPIYEHTCGQGFLNNGWTGWTPINMAPGGQVAFGDRTHDCPLCGERMHEDQPLSVGYAPRMAAVRGWKPGVMGRGLIDPRGQVHTWRDAMEDDPTHMDMADRLGFPHNYDRCFAIDPEGQFRMNAWGSDAEALMPEVMAQRPELKPHPYYYPQYRQTSWKGAATSPRPWEAKMYHGKPNGKGVLGPVTTPFWTTSHEPEALGFAGGEGFEGNVHPVSVRFHNPAHFFGHANWGPESLELARWRGHDGAVVHWPEDYRDPSDSMPARTWAVALDPGTVVPGHLPSSVTDE